MPYLQYQRTQSRISTGKRRRLNMTHPNRQDPAQSSGQAVNATEPFNLVSALIAHASIRDQHVAFAPSVITLLLGTGSYMLWRHLEYPQRSQVSTL
jgi:hypothetical protein